MNDIFISLFRRIVEKISPVYRYCRYSGISVNRAVKYCHIPFNPGSSYRPSMLDDVPDYEDTLCRALSQTVRNGDHVIVVGGGLGVTSLHAAREVGPTGQVTSFEASEDRIKDLKWAIESNRQGKVVTPVHALIGKEVKVYGDVAESERIPPTELPQCDVLELDCEGAELMILNELEISPRSIIVETHGFRGGSTDRVERRLEELGYEVENRGIAEPGNEPFCKENDIRILVGKSLK